MRRVSVSPLSCGVGPTAISRRMRLRVPGIAWLLPAGGTGHQVRTGRCWSRLSGGYTYTEPGTYDMPWSVLAQDRREECQSGAGATAHQLIVPL